MNLVICGDFEHFTLEISKPEETLVSSIIERVATTLDIPSVEISLYFNNQLLQPASPLSPQCGTKLRSGAALLVVVNNPLIITIQRYDTDVSFNVEISRLAAPRWKTDALFEFCLYKAGMPHRRDGKYVFTVQGIVLQSGKTISNYKFLNNNFVISITFLQTILVQDPITSTQDSEDTRSVLIPIGCTDDKILGDEQKKCTITKHHVQSIADIEAEKIHFGGPFKKQNTTEYYGKWRLIIQALDGTKQIFELENHFLTPVYELKRKVSDDNIRLIIGNTVLEDWDEKGRIMLLCSYPQLHDGATLYQINLPDAIRVNLQYSKTCDYYNLNVRLHNLPNEVFDEHRALLLPKFICIENPNNFTVERLIRATANFTQRFRNRRRSVWSRDWQQSMKFSELQKVCDKVVGSVKCLDDGCTMTFNCCMVIDLSGVVIFS